MQCCGFRQGSKGSLIFFKFHLYVILSYHSVIIFDEFYIYKWISAPAYHMPAQHQHVIFPHLLSHDCLPLGPPACQFPPVSTTQFCVSACVFLCHLFSSLIFFLLVFFLFLGFFLLTYE